MAPMDQERAELIAMKIQSYITEEFEKERIVENKMRTKWNNVKEGTLREILVKLELRMQKIRVGSSYSSLKGESDNKNSNQEFTNYIKTIENVSIIKFVINFSAIVNKPEQ